MGRVVIVLALIAIAACVIAEDNSPDELIPEFEANPDDFSIEELQDTPVDPDGTKTAKVDHAARRIAMHKAMSNIRNLAAYSLCAKGKAKTLQAGTSMSHSVITNMIAKFAAMDFSDLAVSYAASTGSLRKQFDYGLTGYELDHVDESLLSGDGAVKVKKVGREGRTIVKFDYHTMGLRAEPEIFKKLSVPVSCYQASLMQVEAASKGAINEAAVSCLKKGMMSHYHSFLDTVRNKYKMIAEDRMAEIIKSATDEEQAAFKKDQSAKTVRGSIEKMDTQAPAADKGVEDEVNRLSAAALKGGAEGNLPSQREMIAEAKALAKKWIEANGGDCGDVIADIKKAEVAQKDSPNCEAIEGDYTEATITVGKGTIRGKMSDPQLMDDDLKGSIFTDGKKACTGTATGHGISPNGGVTTATFKFDKKTKEITWSTGTIWRRSKVATALKTVKVTDVKKGEKALTHLKAPTLSVRVTTGDETSAQTGSKPKVVVTGTKGKATVAVNTAGRGKTKTTTVKVDKDLGRITGAEFEAQSKDGWLITRVEIKSGDGPFDSFGCLPFWLDGKPYGSSPYSAPYGNTLKLVRTDSEAPCKSHFPKSWGAQASSGCFCQAGVDTTVIVGDEGACGLHGEKYNWCRTRDGCKGHASSKGNWDKCKVPGEDEDPTQEKPTPGELGTPEPTPKPTPKGVWTEVFDETNCNVAVNLGQVKTDAGFTQGSMFKYLISGKVYSVYKRLTPVPAGVSIYKLMVDTWSIKTGNKFNVDFKLYSSVKDAKEDKNAWKACNGDDKGVGFPRDCGPTRTVGGKWMAHNSRRACGSQRTVSFSVYKD